MFVDPCGCLREGERITPCAAHREFYQRAERIAWRMSARTGKTFLEAWKDLWERLVVKWTKKILGDGP